MSVDINWDTLTGGPDGEALAETIRDFIHERFQHIAFPKLIRSVKVHGFEFGTIKPDITLKDIGDPLPDFYEDDEPGEESEPQPGTDKDRSSGVEGAQHVPHERHQDKQMRNRDGHHRSSKVEQQDRVQSPALNRGATPFGGTSGLGYFHLPLSAGLSGTSTPLAAVAGAHFHGGLPSVDETQHAHGHAQSFISVTPPTLTPQSSRPMSRDNSYFDHRQSATVLDGASDHSGRTDPAGVDRSPEDMQVVFHVTYSGDVRLSMTADVFLDYPMPSFVGIPLKLNITGVKFNGVGILAYIKKRAHLCFLCPEDAEALVDGDVLASTSPDEALSLSAQDRSKAGGLLEEIKIESEMGETADGRQVLKNVDKIEKFILEQVQRIFEDEFVYPSFWTFLV